MKANKDTEAGVLPSEELLTAMGNYNEELVKSGMLLAGDGLQDSSKGKRVKFSGGKTAVVDGPFTEAKELIAGYWVWQVRSLEEAVEWAKRIPTQVDGPDTEVEIRPLFEMDDFGENLTPELREKNINLRSQTETKIA